MASSIHPPSSRCIRVRLSLTSFNPEQNLWMLVDFNEYRIVSDLEYIIKERYVFSPDGCKVSLKLTLDGYLLPSSESIQILRENDLIVADVISEEISKKKKKKRKRSIQQETDEEETAKKSRKNEKLLSKCPPDEIVAVEKSGVENEVARPSKKAKRKNKNQPTDTQTDDSADKSVLTNGDKSSSKSAVEELKSKISQLTGKQPTRKTDKSAGSENIDQTKMSPAVSKGNGTQNKPQSKSPKTPSQQTPVPLPGLRAVKQNSPSKKDSGISKSENNKTVKSVDSGIKSPSGSGKGKKHIRFSSCSSYSSDTSSDSSSSDGGIVNNKNGPPKTTKEVTETVLHAKETRDNIVKMLQQKGGPGKFKPTNTKLPSPVANRKVNGGVLTNISYIFKNGSPPAPSIVQNAAPKAIIGPVIPSTEKIVSKDYVSMAPLIGAPRIGDKIAYRILEMSSNYAPLISDYREAVVTAVDQDTNQLQLEHSGRRKTEDENMEGRFEMDLGEEFVTDRQAADTTQVYWTELIEPRIMPVS